jgi:hypothetical protein
MRKTKMLGISFVAVVALSAIAAASASAALPEFVTASFPITFTSVSSLAGSPSLEPTLHGPLGVSVVCKMGSVKGEVSTAKAVVKVEVVYTECKDGSTTCTTSGQAAGTVITKAASGTVGYISKENKTAGIEFKPGSGAFAEFSCGILSVKIEGCVIGEAKPTNKSQLTGELLFEENAGKTGQLVTKLEGGSECTLSGFGGVTWLMDLEDLTFSKAVELKA